MEIQLIKLNKITKNLFLIIFCIIFTSKSSYALENKILFTINQEIITTIDVSNEISYLKLLNKEIRNLDNQTVIEIAKNSLIRNKIKKIELLKNIKEIKLKEEYLDKLITNMYSKIGLQNKINFQKKLNQNNLDIKKIEERISIEVIWNQLIYEKFIKQVKIDKKKIQNLLLQRNNQYQKKYLLSEIVFNIKENENLSEKSNLIKDQIIEKGFKNAALLYSVSDTSSLGGELGWINETSLSEKIKEELLKLQVGQQTNTIIIPGGFLILNIDNTKEEKIEINLEKELNKIINDKTNEQLTQFSNMYFNKIQKNIIVNDI